MKLCGKKTPLVYHRRRRRHKTLHHVNNTDVEPNPEDPNAVHVHPTAVKSDMAKHKTKYREDKESRKKHKSKERASRKEDKDKKTAIESSENKNYHFAQNLASDLTAKLMSVLPPESGKLTVDKYQRVDNDSSDNAAHGQVKSGAGDRSGTRTRSKDTRTRDR